MICKHLCAAKLILFCLVCIAPQASIIPAQETYAPPGYKHTTLSEGAVQFTDLKMGVSFTLPRDSRFGNEGMRTMDNGWKGNLEGDLATNVLLHHRHTDEDIWLYYVVPRHVYLMTSAQTDKWLLAEVADKTSQRLINEKLKSYHVRPSSYLPEEIGGQRALTWVAEFIQGKTSMVEYMVLIRSNRTLVEFSIRCPANELDAARNDVEPIMQSVRLQ